MGSLMALLHVSHFGWCCGMGDGIHVWLLTHVGKVFSCEDEVGVVVLLTLCTVEEHGSLTMCISLRFQDSVHFSTASPLLYVTLYPHEVLCLFNYVITMCGIFLWSSAGRVNCSLVVVHLMNSYSRHHNSYEFTVSVQSYRDILLLQIVPEENSTTILAVWSSATSNIAATIDTNNDTAPFGTYLI